MTYDTDGTILNVPAFIASKNPQNEDDVRKIFKEVYEARTATYKTFVDTTVQVIDSSEEENFEHILNALGIRE